MRKRAIFFLSVMMILISVTGCGKMSSETKEAESIVEEVTGTETVAENETTENTETEETFVTEVENNTEPEDAATMQRRTFTLQICSWMKMEREQSITAMENW